MKFFEIFLNEEKIGEMAEFSDECCVLHYIKNTYPKNEWGKAKNIKSNIIKTGWIYKEVK